VALLDALPASEPVRLARGLLDTFTDRWLWEPDDVVVVGLGDGGVARSDCILARLNGIDLISDSRTSSESSQTVLPDTVVSPQVEEADPLRAWFSEEPSPRDIAEVECPQFVLATPRRVMEAWMGAERWDVGTPRSRGVVSATASPFATHDPVWSPMVGWMDPALSATPGSPSSMYTNDRDTELTQFPSLRLNEHGRSQAWGRSGATLSGGNLRGSSGSASLALSTSPAGPSRAIGPDLSWRPPGGCSRWG